MLILSGSYRAMRHGNGLEARSPHPCYAWRFSQGSGTFPNIVEDRFLDERHYVCARCGNMMPPSFELVPINHAGAGRPSL
jgi:hypothetical protein